MFGITMKLYIMHVWYNRSFARGSILNLKKNISIS